MKGRPPDYPGGYSSDCWVELYLDGRLTYLRFSQNLLLQSQPSERESGNEEAQLLRQELQLLAKLLVQELVYYFEQQAEPDARPTVP
eukprot:IDg7346t1